MVQLSSAQLRRGVEIPSPGADLFQTDPWAESSELPAGAPAPPGEGTLPRTGHRGRGVWGPASHSQLHHQCSSARGVAPSVLISGPVSILVCFISLGTSCGWFIFSSLLVFAIPAWCVQVLLNACCPLA